MEDINSLAEKILSTLEKLIYDSIQIKEFGIVPLDNKTNRSPVVHIDQHVGLESWCVKHVYRYTYTKLLALRQKVHHSQALDSTVAGNVNRLLVGALLISADVTTFWNMRRHLVDGGWLTIEAELHFVATVLSHKPKSNEAFSYRRWLLTKLSATASVLLPLLARELEVCQNCSDRTAHNYHSWTHRIWCVEHLLRHHPSCDSVRLVERELNFSLDWCMKHVSEYCGYHYRQYLIKLVGGHTAVTNICNDYVTFISDNFKLDTNDPVRFVHQLLNAPNQLIEDDVVHKLANYISLLLFDLIHTVPSINDICENHESLWSHRRFLVLYLLTVIQEHYCGNLVGTPDLVRLIDIQSSCPSDAPPTITCSTVQTHSTPIGACFLYQLIQECELKFLDGNSRSPYAHKYKMWSIHLCSFLNIECLLK